MRRKLISWSVSLLGKDQDNKVRMDCAFVRLVCRWTRQNERYALRISFGSYVSLANIVSVVQQHKPRRRKDSRHDWYRETRDQNQADHDSPWRPERNSVLQKSSQVVYVPRGSRPWFRCMQSRTRSETACPERPEEAAGVDTLALVVSLILSRRRMEEVRWQQSRLSRTLLVDSFHLALVAPAGHDAAVGLPGTRSAALRELPELAVARRVKRAAPVVFSNYKPE